MNMKNTPATCCICGENTLTFKHVLTQGLPIYCGSQCKSKRYAHECEICGTAFRNAKADTRTCSRSCQTEMRRRNTIPIECYRCKKTLHRPKSDVYAGKRTFCSKRCRDGQHSLDNPSRYGTNWNTARKKRLAMDDYTCTVCKKTDELEVHHKNKLSSFSNPNDANYLENLQTVCRTCHKAIEKRYSPNI